MVEVYAIMNGEVTIEMFVAEAGERRSMEALVKHIYRKIKEGSSQLVQKMQMESYQVYYFWQDQFLFMLATRIIDVCQSLLRGCSGCRSICELWPTSSTTITTKASFISHSPSSWYSLD